MNNLNHLVHVEQRYRAWINNKVMALSLIISTGKARDVNILLRNEFFLEELEHHFMDGGVDYRIWRAFSYLKKYLQSFPQPSTRHKHVALEMLVLIYQELGFDYHKIECGKQPGVSKFKDEKEVGHAESSTQSR